MKHQCMSTHVFLGTTHSLMVPFEIYHDLIPGDYSILAPPGTVSYLPPQVRSLHAKLGSQP